MFALTAASLGTGRGTNVGRGGPAALRHSPVHPRGPEALAAATLSSDKALVGACNRTCAGEDWVQGS